MIRMHSAINHKNLDYEIETGVLFLARRQGVCRSTIRISITRLKLMCVDVILISIEDSDQP